MKPPCSAKTVNVTFLFLFGIQLVVIVVVRILPQHDINYHAQSFCELWDMFSSDNLLYAKLPVQRDPKEFPLTVSSASSASVTASGDSTTWSVPFLSRI